METGLHDELSVEAYAVIDGVDGRAHHIRFKDIDAFDHAPLYGGGVELRRFSDCGDQNSTLVMVGRCDLDLAHQITAPGATWLDHRPVERTPTRLAHSGHGLEVRQAMRSPPSI